MAFKKCTSGVAWSKGRQILECVRLTLKEKQYFTPILMGSNLVKTFHTCPHLSPPVHTCSHLSPPVHTCSHLFTPVHTCSHLFTPVHTCSHLFTPVYTCSHLIDYLRSLCNGSFSLNFPPAKAVIFRSYMLSCWNCIFCSPNRELSNGARLE